MVQCHTPSAVSVRFDHILKGKKNVFWFSLHRVIMSSGRSASILGALLTFLTDRWPLLLLKRSLTAATCSCRLCRCSQSTLHGADWKLIAVCQCPCFHHSHMSSWLHGEGVFFFQAWLNGDPVGDASMKRCRHGHLIRTQQPLQTS